jgi:hypothetical protein
MIADRFEDVTDPEAVRANPKCDRSVTLYGYLRGANLKPNLKVSTLQQKSGGKALTSVCAIVGGDVRSIRGGTSRAFGSCWKPLVQISAVLDCVKITCDVFLKAGLCDLGG